MEAIPGFGLRAEQANRDTLERVPSEKILREGKAVMCK